MWLDGEDSKRSRIIFPGDQVGSLIIDGALVTSPVHQLDVQTEASSPVYLNSHSTIRISFKRRGAGLNSLIMGWKMRRGMTLRFDIQGGDSMIVTDAFLSRENGEYPDNGECPYIEITGYIDRAVNIKQEPEFIKGDISVTKEELTTPTKLVIDNWKISLDKCAITWRPYGTKEGYVLELYITKEEFEEFAIPENPMLRIEYPTVILTFQVTEMLRKNTGMVHDGLDRKDTVKIVYEANFIREKTL